MSANDERLKALATKFFTVGAEEIEKGYTRPVLTHYIHKGCPSGREMPLTELGDRVAEEFAANPRHRKQTFCGHCRENIDLDQFVWVIDGQESTVKVGT